ncbi:MAG: mechanosensitive ion channel family protein, partial [Clostridia bacterium]|nr:mechanosensitive ion channel family protein [Clostridia bacterium]
MPTWEQIKAILWEWTRTHGLRIAVALIILFVSFRIVNLVSRLILRRSEKKNKIDKTVSRTVIYVVRVVVKVLIGFALVAYVGIDTSGLAALLAAGGVTIGLAVNGALGNIAGGVLIIVTRPFRLDDFIEVAGYSGTVEDIRLVSTRLRTPDNKVVVVPNGTASSAVVVNYSVKDTRRIDITLPIGYEDDRPR